MASYADSITPPGWWLRELERIIMADKLSDRDLAERAVAESPGAKWDRSRVAKMRDGSKGWTIPFVVAISRALEISSPVVIPSSKEEADALSRWLREHRSTMIRSENSERTHRVSQALDAAVKAKKDQTLSVDSVDEGSPRSPRTRRASGSR